MVLVPRRAVLGAGLGAGLGVLGLAVVGVDPPPAEAATVLPRRAHFAKSVGRMYTLRHGRREYRARLVHIRNVAGTPAGRRDHCFNLIFRVAGGHQLPDAIYVVSRKGVHTSRLFLSRVGDGAGMQALVNRSA
jgi:uncharacterized protein DUF6916